MKKTQFAKLAASSAALLLLTSGCSLPGKLGFGSSSEKQAGHGTKDAAKAAKKAQKLADKGDIAGAITFAEQAVAAAPQEADYRAKLGHCYLADGRFLSAEQAFRDAMALGDSSPRTVISLSLALTAQGKVDAARGVLTANRGSLPAADYGLALSLLGDHDHAIEVLVDAVRNSEPSAKTRQNLAFAYAMAGRWPEAKVMGEQDLAPDALRDRMVEWAQLARPGAYEQRVSSILGVSPREDSGMPVALALNGGGMVDVAVSAPQPVERFAASVESTGSLAALGPAPTPGGGSQFTSAETDMRVSAPRMVDAPVVAPVVMQPVAAPVVAAPKPTPVMAPAPKKLAPIVEDRTPGAKVAAKPAAAPAPKKAAVVTPKAKPEVGTAPKAKPAAKTGGAYIVQLGAYSSPKAADAAWGQHSKRHPALAGHGNAQSKAVVNGKTVYRVTATGFGDLGSAQSACKQIKAKGGACIVKKS